jgi:hypothetical protein
MSHNSHKKTVLPALAIAGSSQSVSRARSLTWLWLAVGMAAWGCGSDFDSQMTLAGYRVVGIEAAPPEVSPDDQVQLRVHDFSDGDDAVEYEWTLCLHSVGVNDDYTCSSPELEYPLGNTPELSVDFGPDGLDLRRVLADMPAFPSHDGLPRNLEDGFPVWIELRSGPNCRECRSIDTVKRLTLSTRPTASRNRNPVIERFSVADTAKRGSTITLSVDVDSPQDYTDSTGLERREEYLYTWYTSQGKAKPTRTFGNDRTSQLQLSSESTTIEVLVAVRDERGGLAVARQTISVE